MEELNIVSDCHLKSKYHSCVDTERSRVTLIIGSQSQTLANDCFVADFLAPFHRLGCKSLPLQIMTDCPHISPHSNRI